MDKALREELLRTVDHIYQTEEHLIEVISKTSDEEVKQDLINKVDELRKLRQRIVNKAYDLIF